MSYQPGPMTSQDQFLRWAPLSDAEVSHRRAPMRSSETSYEYGPMRSTEVDERDFSDAASDVEVEEQSGQHSMGSARVYAPAETSRGSARAYAPAETSRSSARAYAPEHTSMGSARAYALGDSIMSVRSNQAYVPGDNAMMRTRSMSRTPPTDAIQAHLQLRFGPGDRWPSGEADLPDIDKKLSPDRSIFDAQSASFATPDSAPTRVHLNRLSANEQYQDLEYGYARRLLLAGDFSPQDSYLRYGAFLVRYVSRGERANGDPVAMIDVRPAMNQFMILEHLAKVSSELTSAGILRSARSHPDCMAVVVVFQELNKFFRAYRFDWDDYYGLRVSY